MPRPTKSKPAAAAGSLGEVFRRASKEGARAAKAPPATTSQPDLIARTLMLTEDAERILRSFATELADHFDRKISDSAIIRALLHIAHDSIETSQIVPRVELELRSGAVHWGRPKGKRVAQRKWSERE